MRHEGLQAEVLGLCAPLQPSPLRQDHPGRRSLFVIPNEIAGMLPAPPSPAPRQHLGPTACRISPPLPPIPWADLGGPVWSGNVGFPTSPEVQAPQGFSPKMLYAT